MLFPKKSPPGIGIVPTPFMKCALRFGLILFENSKARVYKNNENNEFVTWRDSQQKTIANEQRTVFEISVRNWDVDENTEDRDVVKARDFPIVSFSNQTLCNLDINVQSDFFDLHIYGKQLAIPNKATKLTGVGMTYRPGIPKRTQRGQGELKPKECFWMTVWKTNVQRGLESQGESWAARESQRKPCRLLQTARLSFSSDGNVTPLCQSTRPLERAEVWQESRKYTTRTKTCTHQSDKKLEVYSLIFKNRNTFLHRLRKRCIDTLYMIHKNWKITRLFVRARTECPATCQSSCKLNQMKLETNAQAHSIQGQFVRPHTTTNLGFAWVAEHLYFQPSRN